VIRHLVVRTLASRMSVACVALLFATMGGARRMDAHAMTGHGSHFGHIIAQSETVVSHDDPSAHAGHHGAAAQVDAEPSQDAEEPSSEECTCVGPCQGGTAPNVTQPTEYVVATHEVQSAPQVARTVHRVYRDSTSHLLPLPNAPPVRV
jgi:hypothetical protein